MRTHSLAFVVVLCAPLLGGADGGEGCNSPAFNMDPAPDMSGDWAVSYEDDLQVEITLGGAVYDAVLGAAGGTIEIEHEGQPLMFDLDCANEAVVCPSEVWATEVSIRQDDPMYPRRAWLQVPTQTCNGTLVDADPTMCGPGTVNETCEQVCDGEIVTTTAEAFGTINNAADEFTFLLGAGVASNGINCVLLGGSIARGDLVNSGSAETMDWRVESTDGQVITEYGGGCLWAGDPDMDGDLEALVLGAKVRFSTSFNADRR